MAHAPDTKEKKIHCLRISKEKLFVSVAVLMVVLGSLCFVDLIDCSEATGSGSCGEHLTWAVDQNGHLTVEGYGDMDDYSSSDLRWGGFNIRTVSLPDGLTSIGAYAFSDCWNLTAVDIQDSVTSIGDCAFYSCWSLGAIELPDSLETIGNQAFFECAALTSIHIPDSVTSIGANSTFAGCLNLAEITVGQNNVNYCSDDGVLYNKEKTALIKYPSSKSGTTFSVPSTVTTIGKHAFSQCLSLTAVSILGPLTDLGDAAFFGCAYLSSVTIPDTLVTIGNQAFQGTGITTIDIPDSVTLIGISALADCNSLTAINVGNSNEYYSSVDGVLFNANKTSLYQYPVGKTGSSYTVPNTVTSIEYSAFIRNTSLTSVTIPNSVTVIEENAFSGCTSLSSINIPGSVVRIGGSAFAQTQLTSVTIPNSVTDMGNAAFRGCFSLETVVLSNNMNAIMGATFEGCDALSSVIIPNSVTYIGERAFCCCYSLESVTIPSSVTYIDNSAFSECRSITTVTIPNSVTYLGDWAFNQCTSLTTATIGNGLTTINQGVFEDCVSLTTLTIGEGVTSINTNAFSGCNRLIEINNRSEMALTPGSLDNGMVAFRALNIYTPMSGSSIVRFFDSQDGSDIFSVMYYDGRYWLTGVTTNDNCVDLPNGFTYDAANVTEYSIYGQVFAGTNLIHLGIPAAVISIDEAILDYVFYDPNAGYVIINSLEDMVGHTFSGDGINLYRDPTVTYYVDGVQVYQEMVKPGIPVAIRDRYVIIGYDVSDWALQTGVAAITESEFTPGATDVIFAATSTIRQFHVYYYVGDELTYTDTYDYNTLVNVRQNYSRIGYTVGGWTTEDVIVSEGRFVLGASNVTFRATSTVNNYGYTVNYYDNLGNVIREQYAGIAEYNSYVEPDIPVIAGYDAPLQTITIRISENGSQNVVNYVYTGHSNVYYYVDEELIHTDNNIYGAQVDVREVHSKRGYTVSPWSTQDVVVSNGRFIIGASDVTFRATSTRNSYSYTVNYINNDTGRQITNPFIGQALYGAEVTPDIVNHTGYDSPLLTVTIEISDDTSLNVVNYRYTPREYTYTFDTLGGSAIPSKTQKFGTYVSPPADPTKAGYIFDGWDNSIPSYMTAENLTFHAVWLDESELANMFILTNSGDLVWAKSDGFYVSQRITDTDLFESMNADLHTYALGKILPGLDFRGVRLTKVDANVNYFTGALYNNTDYSAKEIYFISIDGTFEMELTLGSDYTYGLGGGYDYSEIPTLFRNLDMSRNDTVKITMEAHLVMTYRTDNSACKFIYDHTVNHYYYTRTASELKEKGIVTIASLTVNEENRNVSMRCVFDLGTDNSKDYSYTVSNRVVKPLSAPYSLRGTGSAQTALTVGNETGNCTYSVISSNGSSSSKGEIYVTVNPFENLPSVYTVSTYSDIADMIMILTAVTDSNSESSVAVTKEATGYGVAVATDEAVVAKETLDILIEQATTDPTMTLTVSSDDGKIVLDNTALKNMKTENCTVSLKKVENTLQGVEEDAVVIEIKLGDNHTNFNGGKITVTVPYSGSAKNPTAYCVVDGQLTEPMTCKVNGDGTVSFEVTHLSTFAIAEDINQKQSSSPSEGFPILYAVIGGAVVLVLIGGIVFFLRRR